MVKKSEINEVLKDIGLKFISMRHEVSHKTISYKNQDDKRVKGIPAGSIGPLTSSNAYSEYNDKIEEKIRTSLSNLPAAKNLPTDISERNKSYDIVYPVQISEKVVRVIRFDKRTYPTYTRSSNLDSSYETYWFTYSVKDYKL